jgi:hypothetical protein
MALAKFIKSPAFDREYSTMTASSNKMRPAAEVLSLSSSTHTASDTIMKPDAEILSLDCLNDLASISTLNPAASDIFPSRSVSLSSISTLDSAASIFTSSTTTEQIHSDSSLDFSTGKISTTERRLKVAPEPENIEPASPAVDSEKLPGPEAAPNVDIAAPDTHPDAPAPSPTIADKRQEASPSPEVPPPPEPSADPQPDTTQPFLVPSLNRPTREVPFYNLSASVFRNEARAYGTPEIRNLARKYLLSNPGNTALPINRDVYQNCCLLLGDYENFGALPGKVLERLVITLCYRMNKMQKAEDIFLAMKILDEETLVHRKSKLGIPATNVLETIKNSTTNAAPLELLALPNSPEEVSLVKYGASKASDHVENLKEAELGYHTLTKWQICDWAWEEWKEEIDPKTQEGAEKKELFEKYVATISKWELAKPATDVDVSMKWIKPERYLAAAFLVAGKDPETEYKKWKQDSQAHIWPLSRPQEWGGPEALHVKNRRSSEHFLILKGEERKRDPLAFEIL